ncbi:MAG: hypothetical protein WA159_17275 [Variovorax sp.]
MTAPAETIMTAVQRGLAASRGQWVQVSRHSGVPYHTLIKIAQGHVSNPRIETVQRLVDYFGQKETALAEPAEAKAA